MISNCISHQLKDDKWAPDFGPAQFVPSWGATVTGVRKFLIAYNVNLLSTKEQAHRWDNTSSERQDDRYFSELRSISGRRGAVMTSLAD